MFDGDIFRRFVLHPKVFPQDVFDPGALFSFVTIENDKVFALSLSYKNLMPSVDEMHGHGCNAARDSNERLSKKTGSELTPESVTHYIGFFEIFQWSATSLPLQTLNVTLRRKTENGNYAHFELMLCAKMSSFSNKQRRNDMHDMRDYLSRGIMGPFRHICQCDLEEAEKLEKIELEERPHIAFPDMVARYSLPPA